MTRLTLESEEPDCPWPAIEAKITAWQPDLKTLSTETQTRVYGLSFASAEQAIDQLFALKNLLAGDDIHFFLTDDDN